MKTNIKLLLVAFCLVAHLHSERITLSIKYLGISVVNVIMEDNGEDLLEVWAKATSIASIASKMDNYYASSYSDNYLPFQYRKIIKQKDYFEDRISFYDRDKLLARRISFIDSLRNGTYEINKNSRDFFSALFSLRKNNAESGNLWLDAGKSVWQGSFKVIGYETLNTILGKRKTRIVEVQFQKISSNKQERSDMLTNNLVDEDKKLLLWITEDKQAIPVKAKFMMSPFSVGWKLKDYEA